MGERFTKATILGVLWCAIAPAAAIAQSWTELGDAGQLPVSAQTPLVFSATLTISGSTGPGDLVDMYLISVANPTVFSATTVGGASWDTQLWLFSGNGFGIQANDNVPGGSLQSTIAGPLSAGELGLGIVNSPPGNYLLAISGSDNDPFSAGGDIFDQQTPFQQSGPDGPGGTMQLTGWDTTGATGAYSITITGLFVPAPGALWCFGLVALAARRRRSLD